jgi:hypothetical protein
VAHSREAAREPKLPKMADPSPPSPERSAGESLRAAIQQTLEAAGRSARSGPAQTRERAGELLDEVVRRGRGELARRLERLEGRLAELEEALRRQSGSGPED